MESEIRSNILVVDDRSENLFLIEATLDNLDVNLIMAESGTEALLKIKDIEIALALIDIQMPKMGGIELAEIIQNDKSREKIPIIFVTAHHQDEIEIEKYYNSGAVDFIQKPFKKNILISKVKIFLELNRQKQQIREQKYNIEQTANELKEFNRLLSKRLNYENLLSKISMMAVSMDNIDDFLDAVLLEMGVTLNLCRSCIIKHRHETNTIDMTHEWSNEDIESLQKNFQGVNSDDIPYWTKTLKKGQIHNFSDINDIPDKGVIVILIPKKVLSILAIPLFVRDKYYGCIGFNNCSEHRIWSDSDVEFLLSISRIIVSVTERDMAEKELKSSLEQLHQLSKHIEKIREEERISIARELHDDLGQALTAVKIDLGIIRQKVSDKVLAQRIVKTSALVSDTIKTVQKITFQLRPKIIDDLGLEAGIDWYAGEFSERNSIEVILDLDSDIKIPPDISLVIFRIMQESLTNVSRHAKATKIKIQLIKNNNYIDFIIADNGIGISNDKLNSKTSFGILGMRERADSIGGTLDISNCEGTENETGTSTQLKIPLNSIS